MLYKIIVCVSAMALFAAANFAQTTTDEYKKNEFYVGYSVQRSEEASLNGAEFSVVRNINRYFGIKGDFSFAARNRTEVVNVDFGGTSTPVEYRSETRINNFLGGIQVKDNATKSRIKPFAHALVGVGHGRFSVGTLNCVNVSSCNVVTGSPDRETGFSGAFGGGLDIKVNNRIDIRAIQVDYNPIYFNKRFHNNSRFGIGIVFH